MGIDISLISPPSRSTDHYRPPLALMYLSAFLEARGVITEIIDLKATRQKGHRSQLPANVAQEIVARLCESRSAMVGITCYTPEFMDVMALSQLIKKSLPQIKVIVGGVHPTLKPEDFIYEGSPVDFAVIGEGEVTLYELLYRFMQGGTCRESLGLATLGENGKLRANPPRPLIENIDLLPFPTYNKINMKYYTMPNPYAVRGIPLCSFYISYGRGCPFNCTFCVSKHLRKLAGPGHYVRYRSAEGAADELELLKRNYHIDAFYIIDDTFSADIGRAIDFCEELISRKLDLLWACTTRVNQTTDELLIKMKKSGCVQVDFGIESGSEECLKRVKKGINLSQIREAFEICQRIGMRTFANILVNIPGETEEDLRKTVELLDELKPSICSINVLTPYLGTDVYNESELNLRVEEYEILGKPPTEIIRDKRFLFADHDIDIEKFRDEYFLKYNPLSNFLRFLFSKQYITQILRSHRKLDYVRQIPEWYREFRKQRGVT